MSGNKSIPVNVDSTLIFAQVQKLDKFGRYSVSFVPLNKDEEAKLTSLGVTAKEVKNERMLATLKELGLEGRKVFAANRDPVSKTGIQLGAPKIVDSTGQNTVTALVGNGSTARLHLSVFRYLNKEGQMVAKPGLNTVQIIKLVEYQGTNKDNAITPITGGFVTTETNTVTTTTNVSDIDGILS